MRRFELGMTLGYVKSWGVTEAVREFFQNALDEEKVNSENKMFFEYSSEEQILRIGNKGSTLDTSSLLLGSTTKAGCNDLIGEHGEGYKVATVVLMRNGVTVNIYNNVSKEVWTSKVVRSKRYGVDIVVFDIEKKMFKKDHDLVIELEGVTPEMYANIEKCNLHLSGYGTNYMKSTEGRLLLDEKFSGRVFVEGLFIFQSPHIKWGYDFNANKVKLDRDRCIVDTIDLKFIMASLLIGLNNPKFISDNILNNDLEYAHYYLIESGSGREEISNSVYNDFKSTYGEDSIPVYTDGNYNSYKKAGLEPVMVSKQVSKVISLVDREFTRGKCKSGVDKDFLNFMSKASSFLPDYMCDELNNLWFRKNTREKKIKNVLMKRGIFNK